MNLVLLNGTAGSEDDQDLLERAYDHLTTLGHRVTACDGVNMARPGEVRDVVTEHGLADGFIICSAVRKFQGFGELKPQEVRKVLEDGVLAAANLIRWVYDLVCIDIEDGPGIVVLMPTPPKPQQEMLPWVIAEGALRALVDVTPNMSMVTMPLENIESGIDTQLRSWF